MKLERSDSSLGRKETPLGVFMSKLTAESGRAVQLVYIDENGKMKTDPEAIGALQKLKGPVAVVSLFGKALHGKSFIWNQVSFCTIVL